MEEGREGEARTRVSSAAAYQFDRLVEEDGNGMTWEFVGLG